MSKKFISLILAVVLAFSLVTVAVVSASAAVDADGRYVPSESVEDTNRLYFYMPADWYNEQFNATTAGAYWWGGSDPCGAIDGSSTGSAWPGYKMQIGDADLSLYYLDCPSDVPLIVFNNYLDGTNDKTAPQYKIATQTNDVTASYYSEGDNDFYDNLLDGEFFAMAEEAYDGDDKTFFGEFEKNFFIDPEWGISMDFDNMIYVVDPSLTSENFEGKKTFVGEWYFYYGDGKYGSLPNQDMAEEAGLVYDLSNPATPDTPDPKPTTVAPTTKPAVPAPATDPTSASGPASTGDTAVKGDNTAVQTGAFSMAVIVLTILAVAAGAVLYTRKRYE